METGKYVISAKKVKSYLGNDLSPEMQYFEYVGFDNYSGPMSTGYPCFMQECHAHRFDTEDAAKAWWDKNKTSPHIADCLRTHDVKTLAIRKVYYRKLTSLAV